jgi:DNA modification methylase
VTAVILRGDARCLPLPDGSVDLICTSPPFMNLRSYTDGGQHYDGQIGTGTRDQFLADLWEVTAEMIRVLKPSGSIFVELGDSYTDKCLNDTPHRYAIGCTDKLGLLKRAEIIWHHVNGLPESVTDRVRRSHSVVFHFTKQARYFAATDEIRELHQPQSIARTRRNRFSPDLSQAGIGSPNTLNPADACNPLGKLPGSVWGIPSQPLTVPERLGVSHYAAFPTALARRIILGWSPSGICTECGEGRRPVAQVQPQSGLAGELIETRRREPSGEQALRLREFMSDYRERAGLSRADVSECVVGSRSGACWNWENGLKLPSPQHWRELKRALDLPDDWDHVMLDTYMRPSGTLSRDRTMDGAAGRHLTRGSTGLSSGDYRRVTGYACACPDASAPTRPAVVADVFGGTGTTALVADMLGRTGVTIDRSADYCRIAQWRTADPGERARALGVPKPPPVPDGQGSLFEAGEAS